MLKEGPGCDGDFRMPRAVSGQEDLNCDIQIYMSTYLVPAD